MRASKACVRLRAGHACHRRWLAYGLPLLRRVAVTTRGGSRMRENRTYGSVRGACDETHVPTATLLRVCPRSLLRCMSRLVAHSDATIAARDRSYAGSRRLG